MDSILAQVRDYADQAHGEQQRKYTPERYIVHPIRVMEICRGYAATLPMMAAALLHDVLEDTPLTKEQMNAYLHTVMSAGDAEQTTRLVVELTDVYIKTDYPYWNRRKRKLKEMDRMARISAEGQTIKYADILDNCNEIVAHDPQFAPKFLYECRMLLQAMDRGNPALYQRAQDAVAQGLGQLNRRA